jgi:predicted dehydrogenase
MATAPQEVRVGIVGIGTHFKDILLPALMAQDNVILSAFCDNAEKARQWASYRFQHATVVSDFTDDRFWDAIDCVICASFAKVHQAILEQAILRKKHCFCEKPAALDAAGLDGIISKGIPSNLVIRIGHVYRYMGGGSRFINITHQHRLICLEVSYIGAGPRGSNWNLGSRKFFSLAHLTNAIDFVVAVAGNVTSLQNATWSRTQGCESITAIFKNARCPLTCLFATNAATAFTCKATAIMEGGGVIMLDTLRNVVMTGFDPKPSEKRTGRIHSERDLGTIIMNDGYAEELRDFFAEIRGSGHCRLPDIVQARHVLSIIDQILTR